ncbi:unnamed protein product [Lactuca virosa]|uniref:Uncharacterized protein n=1 Tax=Lactuca virosa TaxID=75947 RepID=A0AAU9LS91_9ASTR|nr:unnamed protein product [Lactuca virosa]
MVPLAITRRKKKGVWVQKIQTKESPPPTKPLIPNASLAPPVLSPKRRGTEAEIHAVASPIIAITKDKAYYVTWVIINHRKRSFHSSM